jgi:hypothetical protein
VNFKGLAVRKGGSLPEGEGVGSGIFAASLYGLLDCRCSLPCELGVAVTVVAELSTA